MCLHTSVCAAQVIHTLLLLFLLECEVERPDGEVHSLWVGLADVEQKVQDSFTSHKAGQQLGYPAQMYVQEGRKGLAG